MPKRALHFSKWEVGMIVSKAAVAPNGEVLIDQGISLSGKSIESLQEQGHTQLILEVSDEFIAKQEHIDPKIVQAAVDAIGKKGTPPEDRAEVLRAQALVDIGKICGTPVVAPLIGYSESNTEIVRRAIDQFISKALTPKVLAALLIIKSINPSLYVHSLAATIVALLVAQTVNLPAQRMKLLAAGMLLHDIGSLFLRPGLEDRIQARKHTLLGYQILRTSGYVETLSAQVALQHRERTDGSGEPLGVIGNNLLTPTKGALLPVATLLGEIAAVADHYANLVSGRRTEQALRPDMALKDLHANSGTLFNAAITSAFLKTLVVFPEGGQISARSGEHKGCRGYVKEVNVERFDKPIIMLTHNQEDNPLETPVELNLLEDKQLRIELQTWDSA